MRLAAQADSQIPRPAISVLRAGLLALVLLMAASLMSHAQGLDHLLNSLGGSYHSLAPEQKELVARWFSEYAKITGNSIDPETGYDSLQLSVRSTFEAVTNALLATPLTDPNGKPLGNALSIVKLVESVHGQIPNTRGDQQFRVYVLLADDALDKLYLSREFKRIGDNGVYHIGYPVNFRQQGGTPSIQVSVTRTGVRADIDVDYRSSRGPTALINGHLTSANSDVRAGGNYFRHVKRWTGLSDWWKALFGPPRAIPKSDWLVLASRYAKPHMKESEKLESAVHDYFQTWLVDRRPQDSLPYHSVKANACIAQFGTGESVKSSLIRLRMYEHMKQVNRKLGKVDSLQEVMQGAVIQGNGVRLVNQPDGSIFSVSELSDDVASSLDCRKTSGIPLVEPLPHGSHTFGEYFGVSTLIRPKDRQRPGHNYYTIWTREEGYWKIVSWYLENPFNLLPTKSTPATEKPVAPPAIQNPVLERAVETVLQDWLLLYDYAKAERFFAPESLACAQLELGGKPTKPASSLLTEWLTEVARAIPPEEGLGKTIQSVDYDPNHKQEVRHAHENAYVLVRVSDDLAHMSSCSFRNSGKAVDRASSTGDATFNLNTYQTIFQPRHGKGDRGSVVLSWALRNDRWFITSFYVDHF